MIQIDCNLLVVFSWRWVSRNSAQLLFIHLALHLVVRNAHETSHLCWGFSPTPTLEISSRHVATMTHFSLLNNATRFQIAHHRLWTIWSVHRTSPREGVVPVQMLTCATYTEDPGLLSELRLKKTNRRLSGQSESSIRQRCGTNVVLGWFLVCLNRLQIRSHFLPPFIPHGFFVFLPSHWLKRRHAHFVRGRTLYKTSHFKRSRSS